LHQLDVNNASLHDRLDEEVYILPPKGYAVPPGKVCRLKMSLWVETSIKTVEFQINKTSQGAGLCAVQARLFFIY